MKTKFDLAEAFMDLGSEVEKSISQLRLSNFEPTGLIERCIAAVGCCKYKIVRWQLANKVGKTAGIINMIRNIVWEPDLNFFNYKLFTDWPYKDINGNPQKRIRIVTTHTNAGESGAIREEILKWWPTGRYTEHKLGRQYVAKYQSDTGWIIDVMTSEQAPIEFESVVIPLQIIDEPVVGEKILSAMLSRPYKGGMLVCCYTPVDLEITTDFIDALDEKKDKHPEDTHIEEGTLWDSCIETGIPNSKGRQRGLMTKAEIEAYIRTFSAVDRNAREMGKPAARSGKIFPIYSSSVHERYFDITAPEWKKNNFYYVMDPHHQYYPFMIWVALTPPIFNGKSYHIVYNEWPRVETLGGLYHEKRKNLQCNLSPEELSRIIKAGDLKEYSEQTPIRGVDTRFDRITQSHYSKTAESISMHYTKFDIDLLLPDTRFTDFGIEWLRMKLNYDKQMEVDSFNEPEFYIMPHCTNVIESVKGAKFEETGSGLLAEKYKDPIDCLRIYYGLWMTYSGGAYIPPATKSEQESYRKRTVNQECSAVRSFALAAKKSAM